MLFSSELIKDLENKKLFLCTPDKKTVGVINNCSDRHLNINLTSISKLTFTITQTPSTNLFDEISEMMKIYVEDIGYFILEEPSYSDDGVVRKKDCKAYSAEHELSMRNLNSFFINYIDDNGFSYGFGTDGANTVLYDPEDKNNSLLDRILEEKFPQWTIGGVHPQLYHKSVGTLCFETIDGYSLLTKELSRKLNVLFLFDIEYFLIFAVPAQLFMSEEEIFFEHPITNKRHYISKNTSVFLSHKNLISSLGQDCSNENGIITCFRVSGGDGIPNIYAVNCGDNYIYDLSYYYDRMEPVLLEAFRIQIPGGKLSYI